MNLVAPSPSRTIDCASCHLATPVSRLVAQPMFGLDDRMAPDAFAADGTFVLASELTATFPSISAPRLSLIPWDAKYRRA